MSLSLMEGKLQGILERCYQGNSLSDYEIKDMIAKLAECFKYIRDSQQNTPAIKMQNQPLPIATIQQTCKKYVESEMLNVDEIMHRKFVKINQEIENVHNTVMNNLKANSINVHEKMQAQNIKLKEQIQKTNKSIANINLQRFQQITIKYVQRKFINEIRLLKQTIQVQKNELLDISRELEQVQQFLQYQKETMSKKFRPNVKINEIQPGSENLKFFAKILSTALIIQKKKKKVKCVLGDETGVVNAFLKENELLVVGKTVALFGAEAKVVKQHIEIQGGRMEFAINPIDKKKHGCQLIEKYADLNYQVYFSSCPTFDSSNQTSLTESSIHSTGFDVKA